jgi:ergothioneine biosynthesis protein EgtB
MLADIATNSLQAEYERIRSLTLALCATLEPEDTVVQSMPDVSPTKWHLAHVTWFFERFVLEDFDSSYRRLNDHYDYLFNSYYYSAGNMHARPKRGLLTRPTFAEVIAYRSHVDGAMQSLLGQRGDDSELQERVVLGLNHEQQHQELLLTDIKHVFSRNPMLPAVNASLQVPESMSPAAYSFDTGVSGIHEVGASGGGFCFDNETPRHRALLHEHRIGSRLVTNSEYRDFIDAGGYRDSNLWLSDGWSTINERGWDRPLYWAENLDAEFTLGGQRDIDANAPVCHVSYYEADAFARWAGARLPTEFEWETAAAAHDVRGNFLQSDYWHTASGNNPQFFGDVWEWTASPYSPYPGFVPLAGSLGEYNGKFMCNQMTVRGGSCVTSADHARASYRSFFYPDSRWQFLGIRLAKDGRS